MEHRRFFRGFLGGILGRYDDVYLNLVQVDLPNTEAVRPSKFQGPWPTESLGLKNSGQGQKGVDPQVPTLSSTIDRVRLPERRKPREGEASRYYPVGSLPCILEIHQAGQTNNSGVTADDKPRKNQDSPGVYFCAIRSMTVAATYDGPANHKSQNQQTKGKP